MVGGGLARTPGLSTVTGSAHQDVAAAESLIPFGIAVAIKPTSGGVVADGPILIVKIGSINRNRLPPMDAVRGAAHSYIADGIDEGESGNQPLTMFGVV